jgi:hypothetical protein
MAGAAGFERNFRRQNFASVEVRLVEYFRVIKNEVL